ncbi:MAG TPA: hypothetical protein PLL75_02290 [Candidatus Omnitrophota bacterium]|nr:hypothetical protein [Candidatus Omnitrophota bacterium]HPS36541.1 hypothetical protein [Candidatus Omnitrophota bacterium]
MKKTIFFGMLGGAFAAFLCASATALAAGDLEKTGKNETCFYKDLFDQNVYSEGVNQIDLGRWWRRLSGKKLASANVNVFDEVPDSAFFTNRQGRQRLSAQDLEKGYSETSGPDMSQPLVVTKSEHEGVQPRFYVKDAKGDTYFLKFDSVGNLELATGAEIVASRFYYAIGYNVPQYTILRIKADQIRVAEGALSWDNSGFKKPLNQKLLQEYLLFLPQTADGFYRASASKILSGENKGFFSFESRRKEDSADPVNHRDRREVRALAVFSGWLNNDDVREGNTVDMLVAENGPTFLKHYLIDFDKSLGSAQNAPKAPMVGYEYAVDFGETFKSILAFGFREKPWQKKWRAADETASVSPAVGYFSNAFFDPARYKVQLPYETSRLVTAADGFWAAKILMSFADDDIRAAVKAGQYSDPKDSDYIAKTLMERRDIIVRYWLAKASPLDSFEYGSGKLSFRDLAVEHGCESATGTSYRAEWIGRDQEGKVLGEVRSSERAITIPAEWIAGGKDAEIRIRVIRASSKEPKPFVTVRLNASGVQSIRHAD